ncbi:MAG: chaperonin GroEL [Deltaproteobacteria bacterium]|nr:chaperonin GroEL [Deltaproteobacteria bacterium]
MANAKRLTSHSAACGKVLKGATALADAVRLTLGPRSKSVLLGRNWGPPLVCNDGVTIAKELVLRDAEENLGAQMLRQAAQRTGDVVGDGTTTATLLAHAIFSEGMRSVAAGASAIDLERGVERGMRVAVEAIRGLSRPVESTPERVRIATISAHDDATIGALVGEAVAKVGAEGVITVEATAGTETAVEIVQGMQFDRGYLSPYFITDPDRVQCVLVEPLVLIHDERIAVTKDLRPLLEHVAKTGSSLLIIAEEVEGEALATLVVNKIRGTSACVAVRAPGLGDRRRTLLEDIAVLTGGQVVTKKAGLRLESVTPSVLGRASRIVVSAEDTTILGGAGDPRSIAARLDEIRRQIRDATSDYDEQRLRERLAKLAGGVAIVRVGAPSEAETKSRRKAFEDAIGATQAAVAEGIVPGAGLALLRASTAVADEEARAQGDERSGLRILRHALEAPTRQLAANSGADPDAVVEHMRASDGSMGFDAASGAYVDLVAEGIIDPTKVVRLAIEHAVSVATVLLLAEATTTRTPEPSPQREPSTAPD